MQTMYWKPTNYWIINETERILHKIGDGLIKKKGDRGVAGFCVERHASVLPCQRRTTKKREGVRAFPIHIGLKCIRVFFRSEPN
jgi:hypothetical protein